MSIVSEITRIKNAKTDIATSIAKKGVTVPEETKIDGYSALIDEIQGDIDDTTIVIEATTIADQQFANGVGLEGKKTIVLPNVETIGTAAFACNGEFVKLSEIETIDIGENVKHIDKRAFSGCGKLSTLIFRGLYNPSTTETLQLGSTPINERKGFVYVPDNDLETYKQSKLFSTAVLKQLRPLALLGTITLQSKTVTPTINEQIVTPDDKYHGLSDVTVKALSLQSKTVPPTKEQQTVTPDNEYVGLSNVTVEAIPNNYIDSDDVTEVTLDITNVNNGQFKNIEYIKKINLPYVEKIEAGAFAYSGVETVDIGASISYFSGNTFLNASKLTTLIIRGTLTGTPKPLTLTGTPFLNKLGYIYVPEESIDRYKHYEFSAVADQVKSLSELKSGDGVDVSGVTATADDVLKGKKIVTKDGELVEGAVHVWAPFKDNLEVGETAIIPKGYHDGTSTITAVSGGGDNPFEGIDDITGVLSEMTVVGDEQFKDIRLKEIRLPKVEQLGGYILGFNSITETLELGEKLTEISPFQISDCSSLKTLILQGLCSLATDPYVTFSGTPIADGTGTVYVPDRYLEHYQNDSLWSDIASQIKPLSEYYGIEVEGAVTGIDPTWTDWRYFSYYNNRNGLVAKLKYSDTSNGTDFSYMFSYCTTLKAVPSIDTSKGTIFTSMFFNCGDLREVPALDTSKGTSFASMFSECDGLTQIPELNTGNGTAFASMFKDCSSLTAIPELDTSNGTSFSYMFSGCSSLTTIPELDTSNGTSLGSMFSNCKNLTTIPKLNMSSVTTSQGGMFTSAIKLVDVGFEGTCKINGNWNVFTNSHTAISDTTLDKLVKMVQSNNTQMRTVTIGSNLVARLTDAQKEEAAAKYIAFA